MTDSQSKTKKNRAGNERILYLMLTMFVVTLLSVFLSMGILYYAAFEQQEQRLLETVKSQARLFEAVARYDRSHGQYEHPDDAFKASLSQLVDANQNFEGFGATGEFTMSELKGNEIIFLIQGKRHITGNRKKGTLTIKMGDNLAVPTQRALSGKSGIVYGIDYRGEEVLAAYEPVRGEGKPLGLVAKIDISEIRQPFIYAAVMTSVLGLCLISIAAFIFRRLGQPLVREIEESEERFRSTFEQAAVGMAHVSPEGKLLQVNEKLCRMLGYRREELLAKSFRNLTYSDDLPENEKAFRQIMKGEILAYFGEKRCLTKEGMPLWVSVNLSLVKKTTGQPKYCICVINDISDWKKAEEELSHKRRLAALGEMSAFIAHDIRSPLSTISLAHDLLRLKSDHSGKELEALQCLAEGIENINCIVADLLDFGKKGKLNRENFPINDLISSILSNVSDITANNNIRAVSDLDEQLVFINADKVKMRQVLTNLMDNAIHAMEEGGLLTVTTKLKGSEVDITISDTGSGMTEEDVSNIFVPYFTKKSRGTGLGMAIVKHYVELHKGTISIDSELNKGTQIMLNLPLSAD